jgi:hypothetical protein
MTAINSKEPGRGIHSAESPLLPMASIFDSLVTNRRTRVASLWIRVGSVGLDDEWLMLNWDTSGRIVNQSRDID